MHKLLSSYFIRHATPDDIRGIAYVHWQSWLTTYKGLINPYYLEQRTLEKCIQLRQNLFKENPPLSLIACQENQVIGFIDAGVLRFHANQALSPFQKEHRREKGEIYALYVLKDYQHQGIGAALFQAIRQELAKKDWVPFLAWVLKDNGKARTFYERQDGKLIDETIVTIGQDRYKEVAYHFEK